MLHQEFETSVNQAIGNSVKQALIQSSDNPRESMEKLLSNLTKYNQVLLEFIVSMLKEVDYKLLDAKGEFKKVGLFQWKNISDYVAFAGFVKDKIIDVKNQIEK